MHSSSCGKEAAGVAEAVAAGVVAAALAAVGVVLSCDGAIDALPAVSAAGDTPVS